MCGYIRRVTDNAYVKALLISVGLDDVVAEFSSTSQGIQHFYPAFGGDANKTIDKLIINERGKLKVVNATWWFDCEAVGDGLRVGDRTTFNARNLASSYWRKALHTQRALVVATGLGESQMVQGKKHQYLMEGATGAFLLGALYRSFENGLYACAVITRPASAKFAQYHDKAMPLFIPHNSDLVSQWLDPKVSRSDAIDQLLDHSALSIDLRVTRVSTYKSAYCDFLSDTIEADL